MDGLALYILLIGVLILGGFTFWLRQRERLGAVGSPPSQPDVTTVSSDAGAAVLVATEHGQLIHINDVARRWLHIESGVPDIETLATISQPVENFLGLFAGDNQSAFQLGTRWVEASSHSVPNGHVRQTVVVLREMNGVSNAVLDVSRTMTIIKAVGELASAHMGLEQVSQVLLEILRQALPFESGELCLWDAEDKVLRPRGWSGDTRYMLAVADQGGYVPGQGAAGWVARHQQPLLINNASELANLGISDDEIGFRSVLAMPLNLGQEFIGTLALFSTQANAYSQADVSLLQATASALATAVRSAQLYARQEDRIREMASLQQISDQPTASGQSANIYALLNERMAKLLEADMSGVLLYDESREELIAQTPFYGLPEHVATLLVIDVEPGSSGRNIWLDQSYWTTNDLQNDPALEGTQARHILDAAGMRSLGLFPMQIAGRRIGTVMLGNQDASLFTPRDIESMRVLATQAAIVVENIRLYRKEQRIDNELLGLQEMTHAIAAIRQADSFYGEITERIARLMNSGFCAILVYDPRQQVLIAQEPVYGMQGDETSFIVPAPSGSAMAQLWQEEDTWYTNQMRRDPLIYEAGMDSLADTAGLEKTLFAALSAGGLRIGLVQVGNKLDGTDYTSDDARLLQVYAAQAAAFIENARLYREVQMRADQAEGLRRVAEMASSVLTTEQTFRPVLREIAQFLDSPVVFISVVDHASNSLITYPRWAFAGYELTQPLIVDLNSPGFGASVALSGRAFYSNNLKQDGRVLPGYKLSIERQNLQSTVMVPLMVGDRKLGELGVANRIDPPYNEDDVRALSTVAAQIAASVERLLLYEATGENLRRRMEELDSVARVSNVLTQTVELDAVLESVRVEATRSTYASGGSIVIVDPQSMPNEPQALRRLGFDRKAVIADIERAAIIAGASPVDMDDYEQADWRPMPADARSAAVAPVMYMDRVVAVIHVYHEEPNHFDERSNSFLMTMAAKASVGFQNSEYFQQQAERNQRLRQRADQLNRIFELGQMIHSTTDVESVMEAVAYSVAQGIGYDTVLMMLVDDDAGVLRRTAHAGLPQQVFQETRQVVLDMARVQSLLKDEYRRGSSYFFPIERVEDWYTPGIKALSTAFQDNRSIEGRGSDQWHDGDMLIVRVDGQDGRLLGLMALDRPYNNLRPDGNTLDMLEIFAHQASTMLENTRLFRESRRSAQQEARLNEMLEAIAGTLDLETMAQALASGMQQFVSFTRLTVALADIDGNGFDLITVTPRRERYQQTHERRANLGQTALARSFADRREHFYDAADAGYERYEDLRQWRDAGELSSAVIPLMSGGEVLGVLHFGSNDHHLFNNRDTRQLLVRVSSLISSAIQNARLFNQAVNLQILNRSVVESIQQGIIVLDPDGRIVTINDFMRSRYDWTSEAAQQHLFDYQPELAEFLSQDLTLVLQEGQPREHVRQTSLDDSGDMVVRNFYMYPLRSGETVRGAVLLVEDVTERTQLEEAIDARANQLAALTEVSARITSLLEREEVVSLAMDEMGWVIPYTSMSVWRRHGPAMQLEGTHGIELPPHMDEFRVQIEQDERIAQLVDTRRVISAQRNPEAEAAILPGDAGTASWMGVPLVNQGHVVGMMVLSHAEPDRYTSRHEHHVAFAFASQVAIALANADLFEQTFQRTNELGTLLEAAQATSATRNIEQVFRTVAELMFSALQMQDCTILNWDEVDDELEVQFSANSAGDASLTIAQGTRYSLREYPARQRALRNRDVYLIQEHTDPDTRPAYPGELAEMEAAGYRSRMLVPLVVRDQSIGLIVLQQQVPDDQNVSQQKQRMARALGSQVAVAIENARLSTETAIRLEELLTINQISQAISSTLRIDDMLPIIREQLPAVTGAEEMYLALYNADTNRIEFPLAVRRGQSFSIPSRELGKDEVSYIIRNRHSLSLGADYFSIDELRTSMKIENGEGDARSYMGVPLFSGDQVLGVLAIRSTERTRAFNLNDERILTTVASQLAAAIQNARLFEQITNFAEDLNQLVEARTNELEAERDRLDTLYQITSELARTLDMEQLLERALDMVSEAMGADDGVILLSDPATDQLYCRAWLNSKYVSRSEDSEHMVHPGEELAQWLIQNDDTDEHLLIINDLLEEKTWDGRLPDGVQIRSALAVILESNEEPLGVMVLLSQKPDSFDESHLKLLVPAVTQVAAAINSADLYQLSREQAERLANLLRTEQEEALKNSAILEGITDGVMLADANGNIVLFNTAAERILQISRDQVLNAPVSRMAGLYGTAAVRWAQMVQEWTARMESDQIGDEYFSDRIDLGDRVVSTSLAPVYIGDSFLGTVSVFHDVTADVEADRIKSKFIENVSHEFRTPLTSIKGYTDLILMGATGQLTEQQGTILRTIKDNVDRLAVLVDDVLNITRLDRPDGKRLNLELIDLQELLPDLVKQIADRPATARKEIQSRVHIDKDVPVLRADREKLVNMINNLVDNAYKYTPSNGRVEVVADLTADESSVLISVSDTGVGIPDHFKEKVWQRFERYQEHALEMDVAGTGLGLSIVRELVEMHNGEAWFESELGQGSTFFVRLPLQQPNYLTDTQEIARIDTESVGD